jgi:hypothetical protein
LRPWLFRHFVMFWNWISAWKLHCFYYLWEPPEDLKIFKHPRENSVSTIFESYWKFLFEKTFLQDNKIWIAIRFLHSIYLFEIDFSHCRSNWKLCDRILLKSEFIMKLTCLRPLYWIMKILKSYKNSVKNASQEIWKKNIIRIL